MDIYIVLDGARVVGASARLQGAELIRANATERIVFESLQPGANVTADERQAACVSVYNRMRIEKHELQDAD